MKRHSWETMVCVSAIAVLSIPSRAAIAAPTVNCTQNIDFGTFLPSCTGNITIKGTVGNGTMNNGCHSQISGVIHPAVCNIQTTLATATMNARITFVTASLAFGNGTAGDLITLDNYRIETAGGSAINTHTFNASLLNPTHTFRVGGRLRFGAGEARGSYSNGGPSICVTSVP